MNFTVFEESIDTLLGIFFTTAALSLLLAVNPLINKSNDALQEPTTVYVQSEQSLTEVYWSGAQVKYKLWDVEKLNIPIYVGSIKFTDLNDVRQLVDAIPSNARFQMKTVKDAKGKITQINFIYY